VTFGNQFTGHSRPSAVSLYVNTKLTWTQSALISLSGPSEQKTLDTRAEFFLKLQMLLY